GPVVRLAPGCYSINDLPATKMIYGHASKYAKSIFYTAFRTPEVSNLFAELDPHQHSVDRRKVAHMYSMTSLVQYEKYVDQTVNLLEEKLSLFAETNQPFDVPEWMRFYALDSMCEITLGKNFGFLGHGKDKLGILDKIAAMLSYSSQIGMKPHWHAPIVWLTQALRQPNPMRDIESFIAECINERKHGKTKSDRADFLAKAFTLHEENPEIFTEGNIMSLVIINIVAGGDTTAMVLSTVVYHLLKQPQILQRLLDEFDTFEKQGKMSEPVTFREAQQMPWLQAIIKEALRVHPPTGLPLWRVVPVGGAQIAGHYFPTGTQVGVNSWVLHNNKDVFGEDAAQFRPDRWLDSPERVSLMSEYLYTFGAGARTCLGKNVSLLEISKFLPQLYRKFNVVAGGDQSKPFEWETFGTWPVLQRFDCRLTPRI
ncbi:putative P450 monooxygenase, partial [Clathrospora elynae]